MNVLIVDDKILNLKLLHAVLEAEGMTVLEARDGVQALELLGRESIDAIISDILMPRMDGYRLCYEVRTNPRIRHLPFIIYTATYTSTSDEQVSLQLGANRFFRKPTPPADLVAALFEILGQPRLEPKPIELPQELHLMKEYSERLIFKLEEKNLELALSGQKLESILNSVDGIVWEADAQTMQFAFVSQKAEAILGYPIPRWFAEPDFLQRHAHPDDQARVREACRETAAELRSHEYEYRVFSADGREVWLKARVAAVSEPGRPVILRGICMDITEHRKLQEQFIQAQKTEVIGQLAGGVAHDFNNILSVIMGHSDLLLVEVDPQAPMHASLVEIREAVDRAIALTRQLLIFSRKQTLQPVVLDINDVVAGMGKMLRRLISGNISLKVKPGKGIGRICADAGYVGQVLMNLAVNARDAMPDGGNITVETANVTVKQADAKAPPGAVPGDYVMLTVKDTGVGMTDEVKARLFEAFFTTKPKDTGTGLGLATCQTIVKQCGGYVAVQSAPGKGATFRIYFPRVDQPLDVEPTLIPSGAVPRGTEILLPVEDEPLPVVT